MKVNQNFYLDQTSAGLQVFINAGFISQKSSVLRSTKYVSIDNERKIVKCHVQECSNGFQRLVDTTI